MILSTDEVTVIVVEPWARLPLTPASRTDREMDRVFLQGAKQTNALQPLDRGH